MQLFIKYINGQTVDHPFMLNNLQQVFPDFDVNNPPEPFVPFERVQIPPPLSVFHKVFGSYVMGEDGIVRDTYTQVLMSDEEKEQLLSERRNMEHPTGWVFDETTAQYEPPIPYPDDGKGYIWNETTLNWELIPE